MILKKSAIAGTLESSDVMISLAPNPSGGIRIDLQSQVAALFGNAIRKTVAQILEEMDVQDALVTVVDKGALDCVIRARLRCAVCRAAEQPYDWTQEDGRNG